jgi:hypothetical protein
MYGYTRSQLARLGARNPNAVPNEFDMDERVESK